MKGLISTLLLAAMAGGAMAQDIPLTKEQQEKADMLGLVDSPVAFVTVCRAATGGMSPELKAEYLKASKEEREGLDTILGMTSLACHGMIRAVADTVISAKGYTMVEGDRICLPNGLNSQDVLARVQRMALDEPEALHMEGQTAQGFILYTLAHMSTCK